MRLYLLPISTRRTLLYCQKLNIVTSEKQTLVDRLTNRAAKLWSDWEKKDSGWQKTIVTYGNYGLRRIPYEEWGLKSVPPLSTRRREEELKGKEKVQLVFPETAIPSSTAVEILKKLGTERQQLHQSRMIWCFVGMPLVAPFALVPVIPNIPFFYLAFRAWSHWRAMGGGKHIQFLVTNNLLALAPSPSLGTIYRPLLQPPIREETGSKPSPISGSKADAEGETLLLSHERGRELAKTLEIPELETELERAIWQVETAIQKAREEKQDAAPNSSTPSSTTAGSEDKKEK